MSRVSKAAMNLYGLIADEWKAHTPDAPTDDEAIAAVKALWKQEVGRWDFTSVRIVRGREHTWRGGWRNEMVINPDRRSDSCLGRGWVELVHDLSHLAHKRMNWSLRPHCFEQARIERRMQRTVLDRYR